MILQIQKPNTTDAGTGRIGRARQETFFFPSFKTQTTASGTCFLERTPCWGPRLGWVLRWGKIQKTVDPPHTYPVLTTITTLGVGPNLSLCTMPNRWLYILELSDWGRCPPRFPNHSYRRDELVRCTGLVASRGLGTGEWGGSWFRYHGDHRRALATSSWSGRAESAQSSPPALDQASRRPRSLSRIHHIAKKKKSLLNPKKSKI